MAQNVVIDIDAKTQNFERALDGLSAKGHREIHKYPKLWTPMNIPSVLG